MQENLENIEIFIRKKILLQNLYFDTNFSSYLKSQNWDAISSWLDIYLYFFGFDTWETTRYFWNVFPQNFSSLIQKRVLGFQ